MGIDVMDAGLGRRAIETLFRFPFVTVSPIGLGSAGVTQPNNGADYGPDTAGTATSGIQEAINGLPTYLLVDGNNNFVTGSKGAIWLLSGVFHVSSLITIPPGVVRLRGEGWSSWQAVNMLSANGLTPYSDQGGSVIVGTVAMAATGVITAPVDSFGVPACILDVGDFEVRMFSPAAPQGGGAPPIAAFRGFALGVVSNLRAVEMNANGSIGGNMYNIVDFNVGSACDSGVIENVHGYGGNYGVYIFRAHTKAINILGGFTNNGAFTAGIFFGNNLDCFFANFHGFSSSYGLVFYPYSLAANPQAPCIVHGVHFESVLHYVLWGANGINGYLLLDQAQWNVGGVNPATDIAASLAAAGNTYSLTAKTGIVVRTENEVDTIGWGANAHVTVPKAAVVAGASPFTYPLQPFDCYYVLTAVAGLSALTLDGQALFGGVFVVGQSVYVGANHSLVATWAGAAPTFELIPQ